MNTLSKLNVLIIAIFALNKNPFCSFYLKNNRKPIFLKKTSFFGFLFILFITILSQDLHAQNNIRFDRLSIDDGLSNSHVTCILQDRKGFMWFGTQDGLNKYDGYTFVKYKYDLSNLNSLPDNYIRTICEDKEGLLWIGTESSGFCKFDPTMETFTHFKHEPENPNSLSHNSIRVIYEGESGIVWIGTGGGGLDRFDPATNAFTHYKHDPNNTNSLSNNLIRSIHKDKAGNLWIGTLNGLNKFNEKNEKWTSYYHDPLNPNSLSNSEVYSILEDRDGILWFGTLDGIYQLKGEETENFVHYHERAYPGFKGHDVQAMREDHSGILWIGTHHGVKRFDKKEKKFTSYQYDSGDPRGLSENNVKFIYEDRSGLLWFGTKGGGISILNRTAEKFLHYAHNPNNANSLSHPSVRGIYEDQDGILWVGGYGGLNRINRETGQFTHCRAYDADGHQLNTDLVCTIIGDPDNEHTLWFGSEGNGLYKFNKNSGKVKRYLHHTGRSDLYGDYTLIRNFVYDLYLDPEGILWIATNGGLNRLDKANEEITYYRHDPDDPYSISSDKIRVIFEDHKGSIWIGTAAHGLNRFNRKTERFTSYQRDPAHPINSLSNNRILSIYEDRRGTLWIGTNGGGLNRFERETETFTYYTEKDGLPNDVIYGILEDDAGNLWLSTNFGLSKFTPPFVPSRERHHPKPPLNKSDTPLCPPSRGEYRGVFRNYDVNDGLQSNEFNGASYFKSKSGEMFFGGINGFNAFYPAEIKDNPYVPPIVITDFQILNKTVPIGLTTDGRSIIEKHISETDEINLSYRDYVFSFEFAALSFAAPAKNKYAYKMVGFDNDWVYTDATKRLATYTNLDPGNYIFRVKGSNNDGIWNETGASINITIMPPFWNTWWFYILGIAGLGIVVFGIVITRVRSIKSQHAAKDRFAYQLIHYQEEERKKIVEELHDALGQDLIIIKNIALLGQEKKVDNLDMNAHLSKIIDASSTAIEDVRRIARNLRPYQLDRLGLTKALESILINVSEFSDITFPYNIDNLDGIFFPENEIHIYRVLQESVNNIIKHSEASEALIVIKKKKDRVILTIKREFNY